jgi:pimeloyl-ACP methyl ester carboxylesterase
VLVDTRAEPDDDAAREKRRATATLVESGGSEAIADDPPPLLSDGAPPILWEGVKETIRRQPAAAIAAALLGMAERPDSRPSLGTIEVPTLVVVGSEDALTPPPLSRSMAEAIPTAELVTLEGAGHLSNLEAPGRFLDALRRFLKRVD